MTDLWPRLPIGQAFALFAEEETPAPLLSHPAQTFAPTGGTRIAEDRVNALVDELVVAAQRAGFPGTSTAAQRVAFDREAAFVLTRHMKIPWAEASAREVWHFLALVALPHVTQWRFGRGNRERWIASDLTRHTWARLWWHGTVFESAPDVLRSLSESDLNQLLERRAIGGDARLTVHLSRAVISATGDGEHRRAVIRDSTARFRRRLAFTDPFAMTDDELASLCATLVSESSGAVGT
ncbi:hypothetical protein CLV46_2527 [Diaminobutyricimonas aerilata]|uniref:Uncharacterized protein n=1 Tax=Diaminobutyricimonas aerilata TaxID=1162967 RepID=A0A2M9CM61_9MICO|nr:hypothetical protein [Diaminobutyricimonas aerilata]PJJ72948.1 hypothetical protein CLV46_2527 [Diaminobutyricimonas aerilata]